MRIAAWLLFLILLSGMQAQTLRIGFYDSTSYAMKSADFRLGMQIWIKELTREKNIMTEVRYYSNPKKLADDFSQGTINMAVATPLIFVRYFDPALMLPGIVGYKSSKEKSSNLLLLVRKEDRKKPLGRLLSGSIAISQLADGGRLYLKKLALEQGNADTLHFLETRGQAQAIFKLFFKKADLCVVTEAAFETACELNPQLGKKLAVYKKENLYIGNFTFLRKGMDRRIREIIVKKSAEILDSARGRQVMIMFGSDTLGPCNLADLETTRSLYRDYLLLRKKKSRERIHEK